MNSLFNGAMMQKILAIKPEDYIEPKVYEGEFKTTEFKMDDFEKQTYTLLMTYFNQIDKIDEELAGKISDEDCSKLEKSKKLLLNVFDSLCDFLIFTLRDRFNIWEDNPWVGQGFGVILVDENYLEPGEVTVVMKKDDVKMIEGIVEAIETLEEERALAILAGLDETTVLKN